MVKLAAVGLAAVFVAGGCASGSETVRTGPTGVVDAAAIDADVIHVGANEESEPEPAGTLIVGSEAIDHFWIQAISAESKEVLANEGVVLDDGSIRIEPRAGLTQLVVSRGRSSMLIGARDDGDPRWVAPHVFDLQTLPVGWTFHPATSEGFMATSFDPTTDPPELLPEGASVLEFTLPDGESADAVLVPSPPESVAGLLGGLAVLGGSRFSGEVGEGRPVSLLPSTDGRSTIVLHGRAPQGPEASSIAEAADASL